MARGGIETQQKEAVRAEIVLQLGDAVFHLGAPVVIASDFSGARHS
jgi:hypothetical protein